MSVLAWPQTRLVRSSGPPRPGKLKNRRARRTIKQFLRGLRKRVHEAL
jgi:hypothetical protein